MASPLRRLDDNAPAAASEQAAAPRDRRRAVLQSPVASDGHRHHSRCTWSGSDFEQVPAIQSDSGHTKDNRNAPRSSRRTGRKGGATSGIAAPANHRSVGGLFLSARGKPTNAKEGGCRPPSHRDI